MYLWMIMVVVSWVEVNGDNRFCVMVVLYEFRLEGGSIDMSSFIVLVVEMWDWISMFMLIRLILFCIMWLLILWVCVVGGVLFILVDFLWCFGVFFVFLGGDDFLVLGVGMLFMEYVLLDGLRKSVVFMGRGCCGILMGCIVRSMSVFIWVVNLLVRMVGFCLRLWMSVFYNLSDMWRVFVFFLIRIFWKMRCRILLVS